MKDNSHEPPQIAIKFANLVFVLGVLFFVFLIIYSIFRIYNPTDDAIIKYSNDELLKILSKINSYRGDRVNFFWVWIKVENRFKGKLVCNARYNRNYSLWV